MLRVRSAVFLIGSLHKIQLKSPRVINAQMELLLVVAQNLYRPLKLRTEEFLSEIFIRTKVLHLRAVIRGQSDFPTAD